MKDIIPKLKNWWWYHKKLVLLAAVVLAVTVYLNAQDARSPEPDYHVGLVSAAAYSPEQLSRMEQQLTAAGEDRNGDGTVLVRLHVYSIDLAEENPREGSNYYEMLGALDGDLVAKVSSVFLLEDPETFRRVTGGILSDRMFPWEEGLFLAIREDADAADVQLFQRVNVK